MGEDVPELPEVETVVRDLRPHVTGCRLSVVRVGDKTKTAVREAMVHAGLIN